MASIQDSPVKKKKRRKRKTPLGKRCMIHVFEKNPGKMTHLPMFHGRYI